MKCAHLDGSLQRTARRHLLVEKKLDTTKQSANVFAVDTGSVINHNVVHSWCVHCKRYRGPESGAPGEA